MGERDEEGKKKKRAVAVAVESLGWLTESSIMPKKHRAIAGVGPSSILELKAQLYRSQEEAKRSKEQQPVSDHFEYQRAKKKIAPRDSLSLKNSGVDARALRYVYSILSFFEYKIRIWTIRVLILYLIMLIR